MHSEHNVAVNIHSPAWREEQPIFIGVIAEQLLLGMAGWVSMADTTVSASVPGRCTVTFESASPWDHQLCPRSLSLQLYLTGKIVILNSICYPSGKWGSGSRHIQLYFTCFKIYVLFEWALSISDTGVVCVLFLLLNFAHILLTWKQKIPPKLFTACCVWWDGNLANPGEAFWEWGRDCRRADSWVGWHVLVNSLWYLSG